MNYRIVVLGDSGKINITIVFKMIVAITLNNYVFNSLKVREINRNQGTESLFLVILPSFHEKPK